MKRVICSVLIVAALSFALTASAQEPSSNAGYKTGLGVRLSSSPAMVSNSISLKHFLNEKTAIEALFSFGDPLALGALVEVHKPFSTAGLQWYYGGGGYLAFGKEVDPNKNNGVETRTTNFGAQGVIGLDYKFANIPLNLSLDWKPELNLIDEINFEPAAIGITARFTFTK